MSAMVHSKTSEDKEEKTTNVGRFLAKRGVLLVKEFRDMSAVKGDYGDKINVATVILSSGKSTHGDVQFGIKLEHVTEDGEIQASGFLDYDEIAEVLGAFDFLDGVAQQMLHEQRDYTEVTYLTKDNLKFGFYQMEGQQQGFVDVGGYGQSVFVSVSRLMLLRKSLEAAKQHLLNRGADPDSMEQQS